MRTRTPNRKPAPAAPPSRQFAPRPFAVPTPSPSEAQPVQRARTKASTRRKAAAKKRKVVKPKEPWKLDPKALNKRFKKKPWDVEELIKNTEGQQAEDASSATDTEGSDTEEEARIPRDFSLDEAAESRADQSAKLLWSLAQTENPEDRPKKIFTLKGQRGLGYAPKKPRKNAKKQTASDEEPEVQHDKLKEIQSNSTLFRSVPRKADALARLPALKPAQQRNLQKLNKAYGQTEAEDADDEAEETIAKLAPQFVVPQHRGLFFDTANWTKESRRDFRKSTSEIGQPIYSTAVLKGWEGERGGTGPRAYYDDLESAQGSKKKQTALRRKHRKAQAEVEQIRKERLRQGKKVASSEVQKEAFPDAPEVPGLTEGDLADELYVRNYSRNEELQQAAFKRKRKKAEREAARKAQPTRGQRKRTREEDSQEEHPLDEIYTNYPREGSTRVSFADTAHHSGRYSFLQKPYKKKQKTGDGDANENAKKLLHPKYNELGKPSHPYSGATYASLHPLEDYTSETGGRQIERRVGEGNLWAESHTVAERETQFDGGVGADRVFRKSLSKFPNVQKPFRRVHQKRYGLNKNLYGALRYSLYATQPETPERTFIESVLSKHLISHQEAGATQAVLDEAESRGKTPVYRTGDRRFSRTLPPLHKIHGRGKTAATTTAPKRVAKKKKDTPKQTAELTKKAPQKKKQKT